MRRSMSDLSTRILQALGRPSYTPLKPKALAKRMGLTGDDYPEFRRTLRALIHEGKADMGRGNLVALADARGTVLGTYRRTHSGLGFVRPDTKPGDPPVSDVMIREGREQDASTGDRVMVKLTRKGSKTGNAAGEVVRIVERATRTFVGTYFERDGEGFVRVDGTVFAHSVSVGDPGAKGVKAQDKVQIEMLRFPTGEGRGEGVITEVFGPLSQPGVDLLTVIRAFGLPEEFTPESLAEARAQADAFRETDLHGRTDFTNELVVTIDPVDARDFDDAVSVTIDPKSGHWVLTVHIADVAHFVKPGGHLDTEARRRGTSVYLPQKVIPMFPEVISNGLASLQQDKVRYVKSVRIEYTPDLQKADVEFFNGAIKNARRFTYEEAMGLLVGLNPSPLGERGRGEGDSGEADPNPPHPQPLSPRGEGSKQPESPSPLTPLPPGEGGTSKDRQILALLRRMRDLALLLRAKRMKRGSLELSMPEAVLEYDANGKVSGAHFAVNDLSHQIIEEFMLAANEAVAEHFGRLGVPFLRRVHPAPDPRKLDEFATFAGLLGRPVRKPQDRFELQKLLTDTADKPERAAIHYAMLRSLKQAAYTPIQDEHYALASQDYCHFTSPIRRYPDLQVHRLLDRWLKTRKATGDENELVALGDHCSKMERRAEAAERELIKLKILQHLSTRIGEELDAVITGVAEYGFFAQAEKFPAEGLVHVSSLTDDYYSFDETSRSLTGGRSKKRYRLGDRVRVQVARVDLQKRMLDLRLVGLLASAPRPEAPARPRPGFRTPKKPDKKGKRKRS